MMIQFHVEESLELDDAVPVELSVAVAVEESVHAFPGVSVRSPRSESRWTPMQTNSPISTTAASEAKRTISRYRHSRFGSVIAARVCAISMARAARSSGASASGRRCIAARRRSSKGSCDSAITSFPRRAAAQPPDSSTTREKHPAATRRRGAGQTNSEFSFANPRRQHSLQSATRPEQQRLYRILRAAHRLGHLLHAPVAAVKQFHRHCLSRLEPGHR
jgi:hypothetical protein